MTALPSRLNLGIAVAAAILLVSFTDAQSGRRPKLDPRSIRTLHTLEPLMSERAKKFLLLIRRTYPFLDVRAIMGTRTYEQQDALYALGRTLPGRPVTNARGGQSNHNFNIAFDLGIFTLGKYQPVSDWYGKLGELADQVDLGWGGNWRSRLVDRPHYQWPTTLTMPELRKLKEEDKLISEQPDSSLDQPGERALKFQDQPPVTPHQTLLKRMSRLIALAENPAGASLSEIRAELPNSVKISEPEWESDDEAVGNVCVMKGPVQGLLVFAGEEGSNIADHLSQVQVYLGDSLKTDAHALGRQLRSLFTKRLHLSEAEEPVEVPPDDSLPDVYGYRMSWTFKNGRRLDLWHHWYGHQWVLCMYLDPKDLPVSVSH